MHTHTSQQYTRCMNHHMTTDHKNIHTCPSIHRTFKHTWYLPTYANIIQAYMTISFSAPKFCMKSNNNKNMWVGATSLMTHTCSNYCRKLGAPRPPPRVWYRVSSQEGGQPERRITFTYQTHTNCPIGAHWIWNGHAHLVVMETLTTEIWENVTYNIWVLKFSWLNNLSSISILMREN